MNLYSIQKNDSSEVVCYKQFLNWMDVGRRLYKKFLEDDIPVPMTLQKIFTKTRTPQTEERK